MLGGVCGGIAEYMDADPVVVRLIYAAIYHLHMLFSWTAALYHRMDNRAREIAETPGSETPANFARVLFSW